MKRYSLGLGLALALTVAVLLAAQSTPAENAFTPDQVKYGPVPAFLPPGAELAVLEGDPMASTGDFTIRLKMPDGLEVARPHASPPGERDRPLRHIESRDGRSI